MSSCAHYFGEAEAGVFGWLHLPDDRHCRGGVVLVPTIAIEEMSSHNALRLLALRLEALGFAVVRFDYPGTGNSAGTLEVPEVLDRWIGAVGSAARALRELGAPQVDVVGLRIGALVAMHARDRDRTIENAILWDPPATGKAFLREQEALRMLSIGAIPGATRETVQPGEIELVGLVLPRELAQAVAELSFPAGPAVGATGSTLALVRGERPLAARLSKVLEEVEAIVDTCWGQGEFIDVLPDKSVIPVATIDAIVDWIDGHAPDGRVVIDPVELPQYAVVEQGIDGPIVERAVHFGEHGLFGIVTESVVVREGPSVILLNAGILRHVGPARLWVTIARRLSAAGIRVFRFDLSGIGDSAERPGQQRFVSYPPHAIEDIEAAIEVMSDRGAGEVVLGGLCAGAYHAIEAGLRLGTAGACAINPILSFDPPEVRAGGEIDPNRHAVHPYRPYVKWVRKIPRVGKIAERSLPLWFYGLLDRLGLQPAPARGVAELVAGGTAVFLLCGELESLPFDRRSPRQMRVMRKSGRFDFVRLSGADHALLGADARAFALEAVVDGLSAAPGTTGRSSYPRRTGTRRIPSTVR